jgi:hypothetical protein
VVEAGGQLFHGFRHGLDYAFVRAPCRRVDAERVIQLPISWILVPARGFEPSAGL